MIWARRSLAGWGRALRAETLAARPERAAQPARLLAGTDGPVCAAGALRSYGDAALNSGGRTIITTRLDRVLAFDPAGGVAEVEAGVTIGALISLFAPMGWMPAVAPGTGFATVGGCIANDVHGKNHHGAGSFGQHVESIELLGPDGAVRRVAAGEPLFGATVGGVGLTGMILSARLRLARCPARAMAVEERRMPDLDAFMDGFEASRHPFAVGWVDATATGREIGRGILEEADFAPPDAPVPRRGPRIRVPLDAPGFLLSGPVVRTFNRAWARRVPAGGRMRVRALESFLFPLDGIADWNRLYGRRGFHQFQCVLPHDAAEALHAMLAAIGGAGLASPLAVLKRLGPGRGGLLSFPMEGWTLAVDLPNRPEAVALIRRLNNMTLEAGGRIYLAKDSLAAPGHLAAMYPELDRFRSLADEADPAGRFVTDLARRLELRG